MQLAVKKVRTFIVEWYNAAPYYNTHALYFCTMGLVGGIIIFFLEQQNYTFVNTLFMGVSAVTETGLSSIDVSKLCFGSQLTLWLLMVFGGTLLFSTLPPLIRMYYFDKAIGKYLTDKNKIRAMREHKALSLIMKVAFTYWFSVQFISFVILGLYLSDPQSPAHAVLMRNNVSNPWWFAAFHAVSSFNNNGFALLSDNMCQFADDRVIMLVTSTEILLGNCFAPIGIRMIIWILSIMRENDESLVLLLNFPRTCFTHMFGEKLTVMLGVFIVLFTLTQMAVFIGTNWNHQFLSQFDSGTIVLIAYFQAISARTGGFNAVNLFDTTAPTQYIYCVCTFLSA